MYIYIRSMSEAQTEIYRKVRDAMEQIDKHIIKLLLLPDCQEANHWKREIPRFLESVSRSKHKKKWPDKKFLLKCMAVYNDMIDTLIWQVSGNLVETDQRYVSEEEATWAIETYQEWLAEQLSTKGGILYSDAYKVLYNIIETVTKNDISNSK